MRRNKRPAGEPAVQFKTNLAPETVKAIQQAARASGNISQSLYLERLAALVRAEHGALPALPDEREAHSAAA